jgi:hypothetical protein
VLRARIAANESAAIGTLKTINNSQAGYAAGAATDGGYAVSLEILATPCPGSVVGFISADRARDPSVKTGYRIALVPGEAEPAAQDCNGRESALGYYATAKRVSIGLSGNQGFTTSSAASCSSTRPARCRPKRRSATGRRRPCNSFLTVCDGPHGHERSAPRRPPAGAERGSWGPRERRQGGSPPVSS